LVLLLLLSLLTGRAAGAWPFSTQPTLLLQPATLVLPRVVRPAGPRSKPVISEETLEELDANRVSQPKRLPASVVKVCVGGGCV